MELLLKKDWKYSLMKEGEKFMLSVVCGSIGLYEIEIELNPFEVDNFKKAGQYYIEELVEKINKNPKEYISRNN